METYQANPIDETLLKMMNKYYEEFIQANDSESSECLLVEEKIIYTSIILYEGMSSQNKLS